VKKERDPRKVESALTELKKAAVEGTNLMPPLIQTVKTYATLAEMVRVFKDVWGTYSAPSGV
jgi:methylmalonyl-CoA mutase N-terminal domain/subunit